MPIAGLDTSLLYMNTYTGVVEGDKTSVAKARVAGVEQLTIRLPVEGSLLKFQFPLEKDAKSEKGIVLPYASSTNTFAVATDPVAIPNKSAMEPSTFGKEM